ncbi:MAG: VWA domain-containing protein, partial [Myxococcales bacterium]|nr:VWA domain-containing protein [Myxococcales bacterium]
MRPAHLLLVVGCWGPWMVATAPLATAQGTADPLAMDEDLRSSPTAVVVPKPRGGPVLVATPGLRETHHDLRVVFGRDGLARVEVTFEIRNPNPFAGTGTYRLRVPWRVAATMDAKPLAAERTQDHALLPIPLGDLAPQSAKRFQIEYATPYDMVDGWAELTLPGRGEDGRIAPTDLSLRGTAFDEHEAEGAKAERQPARVDPWFDLSMRARLRTPLRFRKRFPCPKDGTCLYSYAAEPTRPARPLDITLLFDVSPSTDGASRTRMWATAVALLEAAPQGSRIRFIPFASEASEERSATPVTEVDLAEWRRRSLLPLGGGTSLGPWFPRFAKGLPVNTTIVILGDGGLSLEPAADLGLEGATPPRRIVVLSVREGVDPRWIRGAHRSGGTVLMLGRDSDNLAAGRDHGRVRRRLRAIFTPRRPTAFPGRSWSRREAGQDPAVWARTWHRGLPPRQVPSGMGVGHVTRLGASSKAPRTPMAQTLATLTATPPPPRPRHLGQGVPASTVLTMLRERIVPLARACFR